MDALINSPWEWWEGSSAVLVALQMQHFKCHRQKQQSIRSDTVDFLLYTGLEMSKMHQQGTVQYVVNHTGDCVFLM